MTPITTKLKTIFRQNGDVKRAEFIIFQQSNLRAAINLNQNSPPKGMGEVLKAAELRDSGWRSQKVTHRGLPKTRFPKSQAHGTFSLSGVSRGSRPGSTLPRLDHMSTSSVYAPTSAFKVARLSLE